MDQCGLSVMVGGHYTKLLLSIDVLMSLADLPLIQPNSAIDSFSVGMGGSQLMPFLFPDLITTLGINWSKIVPDWESKNTEGTILGVDILSKDSGRTQERGNWRS